MKRFLDFEVLLNNKEKAVAKSINFGYNIGRKAGACDVYKESA